MQDWDLVIHNVHLATMEHGYGELLDADDAQEWRLDALQRTAVFRVDLFI